MKSPRKPKIAAAIFVVLLSIFFARILVFLPLFESIQLKTLNSFFKQRGPIQPPDSSIVIVAIDDQSLNSLPAKWPFPGSYYGRLVRNLNRAGAKVIVFDVEFIESNANSPEEDFDFADAIKQAGNVILAGKVLYEKSKFGSQIGHVIRPNAWFLENAVSWGIVNSIEDSDGFLRRYFLFQFLNDQFYYPLALEAFRFLYQAEIPEQKNLVGKEFVIGDRRIPKIDANTMMINFSGQPGRTYRTYSFCNILDDSQFTLGEDEDTNIFESHLQWGTFKDKIVFVGATAEELWDNKFTPFYSYKGEHIKMAGVESHANALSTIMRGNFLRRSSHWFEYAVLLLAVIAAALCTIYFKPWLAVIAVLIETAALWFGGYYLFLHHGELTNVTAPFLGIAFSFLGGLVYTVMIERKERYRIRKIFQHYVSPSIVDKMLESDALPIFGGERRMLTVLFSDIRRFSSFSEKHEPEFVVSRLSEYLTEMVDIIFKNDGTLDKFVGDEVMALFGAPYFYENHAEQACRTALQMLERLQELKKKWNLEKTESFDIGIGINSGDALVGNLGSSQVFDYTVIGNEINLGARLESANKIYKTSLLITENTYKLVGDSAVAREIDFAKVVGIQAPVRIYELLSMQPLPEIEQQLKIDAFAEALGLYRKRMWGDALKMFRKILRHFPGDGPSRLYTVRCLDWLETPPPHDWDGVHELLQK